MTFEINILEASTVQIWRHFAEEEAALDGSVRSWTEIHAQLIGGVLDGDSFTALGIFYAETNVLCMMMHSPLNCETVISSQMRLGYTRMMQLGGKKLRGAPSAGATLTLAFTLLPPTVRETKSEREFPTQLHHDGYRSVQTVVAKKNPLGSFYSRESNFH